MGRRRARIHAANVWAPSISRRGATVFLYYCLSSFGGNSSAIGLMTNASFDPAKPGEGWTRSGPSPDVEARRRFQRHRPVPHRSRGRPRLPRLRLVLVGHQASASSIRKPRKLKPDAPVIAIASRSGGAVEASSILEHEGKFILFVSFDQCCKGVASTYSIRVGRADRIEGPYVDKDGKAMLDGGGSLAARHDRPLHRPRRTGAGEDLERRHARLPLLRRRRGRRLQASSSRRSIWSADGWPELGPLPQ